MAADSGQVVLVTGGAAGIGLKSAQRFAAEGFAVALLDIDAAAVEAAVADLRATGATAVGIAGSVTDEAAVVEAVGRTVAELGALTVLVNSAGISCNAPTLELSLAQWQRALDINLTGTFLCAREAARHMIAHQGGVILNLGSVYGTVAAPERAGYCATKGGIDILTRSLAIEWARFGVRVNTIAPGYVQTNLVDELVRAGRMDREALMKRTPLGRFAEPEEIAELAFFLASDRASFITGQTIGIDGGWAAYGYV